MNRADKIAMWFTIILVGGSFVAITLAMEHKGAWLLFCAAVLFFILLDGGVIADLIYKKKQ